MHRTAISTAPTITLLTRSPSSSRNTQNLFNALFGMRPIGATLNMEEGVNNNYEQGVDANSRTPNIGKGTKEDSMNDMFHPLLRKNWDSVASVCPTSGTILHFISLTSKSAEESAEIEIDSNKNDSVLSLLSVTQGPEYLNSVSASVSNPGAMSESVQMSRQMLASHMEQHSNPRTLGLKIAALHALGKPITHSRVMGRENNGIPLLELPTSLNIDRTDDNCEDKLDQAPYKLREVVLPYFDDSTTSSGRSLLGEFSNSLLTRPITGLYQWPLLTSSPKKHGVAFRPLPCGTEDLNLPPPTLVFQCQSIDDAKASIEKMGGSAAKVGFSGSRQQGQLRVTGLSALNGLDGAWM